MAAFCPAFGTTRFCAVPTLGKTWMAGSGTPAAACCRDQRSVHCVSCWVRHRESGSAIRISLSVLHRRRRGEDDSNLDAP